jgi:glycerol-3-phosphate responsive antiterminator
MRPKAVSGLRAKLKAMKARKSIKCNIRKIERKLLLDSDALQKQTSKIAYESFR